jgi:sulfatase modifying factor 1
LEPNAGRRRGRASLGAALPLAIAASSSLVACISIVGVSDYENVEDSVDTGTLADSGAGDASIDSCAPGCHDTLDAAVDDSTVDARDGLDAATDSLEAEVRDALGADAEASSDADAACTPITCPSMACDSIDNGCGGTIACGGCIAPSTCGGGGKANECSPPSCGAGLTCGTESCCTSILVPGVATATFSRSYDGVTSGYTDASYKAKVSSFRLDKYEITVGRFRKYVAAVVGGWKPSAGSGKHSHLNGGLGLAASGGGYEPGWDATWNTATNFPTVLATWDTKLATGATIYANWTSTTGANEQKPINGITWYDGAAFCIWDGGFLPSEAEWNYAAAGGTEQRVYPWSSAYPPGSSTISDAYAVYCGGSCSGTQNVGSKSPLGNGKWGHADLAGNVWESILDWNNDTSAYNETLCTDCVYAVAKSYRVVRGGSFGDVTSGLVTANRGRRAPTDGGGSYGARCARTP